MATLSAVLPMMTIIRLVQSTAEDAPPVVVDLGGRSRGRRGGGRRRVTGVPFGQAVSLRDRCGTLRHRRRSCTMCRVVTAHLDGEFHYDLASWPAPERRSTPSRPRGHARPAAGQRRRRRHLRGGRRPLGRGQVHALPPLRHQAGLLVAAANSCFVEHPTPDTGDLARGPARHPPQGADTEDERRVPDVCPRCWRPTIPSCDAASSRCSRSAAARCAPCSSWPSSAARSTATSTSTRPSPCIVGPFVQRKMLERGEVTPEFRSAVIETAVAGLRATARQPA